MNSVENYLFADEYAFRVSQDGWAPGYNICTLPENLNPEEVESILNAHKDVEHVIWKVIESSPYFDSSDTSTFLWLEDAQEAYDELVASQGSSSFDDDDGGMDYSVDYENCTLLNYARTVGSYEELLEFINKTSEDDNREINQDWDW